MAANPQPTQWLEHARKHWGTLAKGAIWVSSVVGGFWLPPSVGLTESAQKTWLFFARFISAVVVGLMLVTTVRWNRRSHTAGWWSLSFVSLLLAIFAYLGYQHLTDSWTLNYRGRTVLRGATYSPQAAHDRERNPGENDERLLDRFAGKAEDVWTADSVNVHRLYLGAFYIASVPLFAVCMMAVVQAISCMSK